MRIRIWWVTVLLVSPGEHLTSQQLKAGTVPPWERAFARGGYPSTPLFDV